jgi:osmoprotectant transport system substrate-binding protein
MPFRRRTAHVRSVLSAVAGVLVLVCAGCGSSQRHTPTTAQVPSASTASTTSTSSSTSTTSTSTTPSLPGTGKPPVTIGDKNFTEQFILGQLYLQALEGDGFTVQLNQNIGPTDVTMQALTSGRLAMYPEYLNIFNSAVAGDARSFRSQADAYQAAERYALAHGLVLLDPTPFSDTAAIGVTAGYAAQNRLRTIADLRKVATTLTIGAPQGPNGLSQAEQVYGFAPAAVTPLAIGDQYTALDDGSVQAADVSTTDAQLASGNYVLLRDPRNAFGWGNAVPVVPTSVLNAEGPAFATTINRVSALLSDSVMRQLNEDIDVSHEDPAAVAKEFLETHGVLPPSPS